MVEEKLLSNIEQEDLTDGGTTILHSHAGGGGGLVDKGGIITTDSNGEAIVIFNTPYPNTDYFIMVASAENLDCIIGIVKTGSKTVNGFTLCSCDDKGMKESNVPMYWCTGIYSNL